MLVQFQVSAQLSALGVSAVSNLKPQAEQRPQRLRRDQIPNPESFYSPWSSENPRSPSKLYKFSVLMKSYPASATRVNNEITCECATVLPSASGRKRHRQWSEQNVSA